ncbi:hypothetical protein [Nocardia sp. NPDC057272]|uniref:hypothetical protein n=1 Tax=Nocardia sp. NPDC057272 TaxID=3346079 RepID=UPI00362DB36E
MTINTKYLALSNRLTNHAPLHSNPQAQSAFGLVAASAHHVGFALIAAGLADWGGQPDGHAQMQERVANQQFDTLSLAPISYAAASAVTCVDLCAAAAYRLVVGDPGRYEIDFQQLRKLIERQPVGTALPTNLDSWARAVIADPTYSELKEVRNRMVHRDMPSTSVVGSEPGRTRYPIGGALVTPEDATKQFTDFAIRHFEQFVDAVLADFA